MTSPTALTDTETLAEVLAAHRHPGEFLAGLGEAWLTCSCGERIDLPVRDGKVSTGEAAALFEAHQATRLAARIVQARAGEGALREGSASVLAISSLIDASYPATVSVEAHRWRRCVKVAEEIGEVTEALLGLEGENPRKGITHTLTDVRKELLDVALAALGAVAHLDGNNGDPIAALSDHAAVIETRLRAALTTADPS